MRLKRITSMLLGAVLAISSLYAPVCAADNPDNDNIKNMISEMTVEEKIEQMLVISLRTWKVGEDEVNVTSLNDSQKELLKNHNFGGVIFFAQNCESISQIVALSDEVQQAALSSNCKIPLLVSIDQEGGNIVRLPSGTITCGNMALGATGDASLAFENASIIGSELKALGINTNFAPVLDVNNNPANPVINVRSFSSDPEIVSAMGEQYIAGLKSENIVSAAKHFPGHGDTATDSHTGLPLINKTYEEIKKLELVPYISLASDVDMIMTAHIQFPKIEPDTYESIKDNERIYLPATLSDDVITGILRNDLGYDGVVITDSMLMDAIKKNFNPVDAAVYAINAGVDMILEPLQIKSVEDMNALENYISEVAGKVRSGEISEERLNESVERILTLKQKRGILDYSAPDADLALSIVGSKEHRDRSLEIAEKGITLIKNDNDLLPLNLGDSGRVCYFFPYANVENTMAFAMDILKKNGVVAEGVTADCNCYRYSESADEFEENIKNCDVVIVALEMYNAGNINPADADRGWQARFVESLIKLAHENDKKVIYISANLPYDVAKFTEADAILATYCSKGMGTRPTDGQENPAYGVNYPAALITVFGGNSPTATLPIEVYALDENVEYTDNILYNLGYGLRFSEDVPEEEPADDPARDSDKPSGTSDETDKNAATGDNTYPFMLLIAGAASAVMMFVIKKRCLTKVR